MPTTHCRTVSRHPTVRSGRPVIQSAEVGKLAAADPESRLPETEPGAGCLELEQWVNILGQRNQVQKNLDTKNRETFRRQKAASKDWKVETRGDHPTSVSTSDCG